MSEPQSPSSSQETLEEPTFPKVLETLRQAAADAVQSRDFLTYSTVLDIYLSEPARYTNDERETLLQHLIDTLADSDELVREIGWDLPALVVPFVDSDFAFQAPIRQAPGVYKVLKVFEMLALRGNAKELFLKCTELLSSLRMADSPVEPALAFKFFDIKLYCIFELIDSSMRRIHTLYPSRFLAMTVANFINNMRHNAVPNVQNATFVLKRVYSFARNYAAPPRPDSAVSSPDSDKILADENYLQRKLLTAFVSESVSTVCRCELLGLTVNYFLHLQDPNHERFTEDRFELCLPVIDRLRELSYSLDMDIEQDLLRFYKSSPELMHTAPGADEDNFTGDLFERLVVDYQQTFGNSLLDSEAREVKNSLAGSLILHTYLVSSTFGAEKVDLTFHDIVCSCIRMVVPGMVHKALMSRGLQDTAVFWCWYAVNRLVQSPSKLELELSSVPKVLLQTFLQSLLFVLSSSERLAHFRYATLTLMTRILSSTPEDIAYDFIIDALEHCPFDYVKTSLIGVLRVLLLKDREPDSINALESIQLQDKQDTTKRDGASGLPPALPKREMTPRSKFINLNSERMEDLVAIVGGCVGTTFETDSPATVNAIQIPTLSAYLNLLVTLKNNPCFDKESVKEIADEVSAHIDEVEKVYGNDEAHAILLNAVNILRVAIQRLA